MKRLTPEQIAQAREIPLLDALDRLGFYVSQDTAFQPRKDQRTVSVFITGEEGVRELILTNEKWFDKREKVGGGGAIDLAMHLLGMSFTKAVRKLCAEEGTSNSNY
jgi:hypothetical protein